MPRLPAEVRAQLLVDPFSHRLETMSRRRLEALGVPGSLEGMVWNVFGSLAQLDPRAWLPALGLAWRGAAVRGGRELLRLGLWESVPAPPARQAHLRRQALRGQLRPAAGRMRRGRVLGLSEIRQRLASKARAGRPLEPPVEIGATIRTPRLLVYVLPVLDSELEMQVECDRARNVVLRAVDAGLHELERRRGGSRAFHVLILYRSADRTPRSIELVRRYRARPQEIARALGHRRKLSAGTLRRVLRLARWEAVAGRLSESQRRATVEPTEMVILNRLLGYFEELGIGSGS